MMMVNDNNNNNDDEQKIDEAIQITIDSVFSFTIRLCSHSSALRGKDHFPSTASTSSTSSSSSSSSTTTTTTTLITDLLFALSQQAVCKLVRHCIQFYAVNKHKQGLWKPQEIRKMEMNWAKEACQMLAFQYSSLFMRYFIHICSFQFE